jgi:hypothetical protein
MASPPIGQGAGSSGISSMSIVRHVTLTAGVLLASLHGATASAKLTLCAGSVADMVAHVQTINAQPGQDFDLRIRSGYYAFGTSGPDEAALNIERSFIASAGESRSHRISGRWNDTCTAQLGPDVAGATSVLDGQFLTRILEVSATGANASDAVHILQIDNLTLFRASETSPFAVPSALGVSVAIQNATRFTVLIDRVRVQDSAGNLALTFYDVNQLTIRNSLFLNNECQTIPGQCPVSGDLAAVVTVRTRGQGRSYVHNNTFRFNFVEYPRTGFDALDIREGEDSSDSRASLYNNIFADDPAVSGVEVVLRDAVTFRSNVYRAGLVPNLSGAPLDVGGNSTADPGFANANTLALGVNSVLRDTGTSTLPGTSVGATDYAGYPRVQGAAVEPGAYELTDPRVFSNGFE